MRTTTEAVAWGRAQVTNPTQNWRRLCLSFVRQSFGLPVVYPSAGDAWDSAEHKHRTSDPDAIPFGVPVFWDTPGEAEHVALSLGKGRCLSNDIIASGRISEVPISKITSDWNATLLGWTEDLNGYLVYTAPSAPPSRGKRVDQAIRLLRREIRLLKVALDKAKRPGRRASLKAALRSARAALRSLRQIPKR